VPRLRWLAFAALACACGPIGPVAGGELGGTLRREIPAEWSFTDAHARIQLETDPFAPYSVNTWCAAIGPALYVPTSMIRGTTHPADRTWVRNLQADPRVRVRIGDDLYELIAVRVDAAAEYEAARARLEAKYGLDPAERDPAREVWIYRLEPRPRRPGAG
jgi:hypothetical protein